MTKHLYMTISEVLEQRITNKIYPLDSLLPTEQALQDEFGVSRATIRNAMKVLLEKDLIHRIRGDGTYIKSIKTQHNALSHTGFTEEVEQQGGIASTRIISFQLQQANEYVAHKLNLETGSQVYFIKRVRLINEVPEVLEQSYMPFELFPDLSVDTIQHSKYLYVENKLGHKIKHSRERVYAEAISTENAKQLNLKSGSATLCVEATGVLEDGTIFDFSVNQFSLKQFSFEYISPRSSIIKQ